MGVTVAQYPQTLLALLQAALHDTDWFVRSRAARALAQIGPAAAWHPEVLSAVEAALQDNNPNVRAYAAGVLRLVDGVTIQQSLQSPVLEQQVSRDQGKEGLSESAALFNQAGETNAQRPEAAFAFEQALRSKDSGVRRAVIRALAQGKEIVTQRSDILSSLVEGALHDAHGGVRTEAAEALGRVQATATQHTSVQLALVRLVLRDADAGVRARAAQALGRIGNKAASQPEMLSALVQALRDADADVRFRASEALGQIMAQGVRGIRRRWGKVEGKTIQELAALRE